VPPCPLAVFIPTTNTTPLLLYLRAPRPTTAHPYHVACVYAHLDRCRSPRSLILRVAGLVLHAASWDTPLARLHPTAPRRRLVSDVVQGYCWILPGFVCAAFVWILDAKPRQPSISRGFSFISLRALFAPPPSYCFALPPPPAPPSSGRSSDVLPPLCTELSQCWHGFHLSF